MPHRIIRTDDDVADFTRFLHRLKLPVTVEWRQGADRTRDQNALQFLWANEVAQQLGDQTAIEVQREWKLRHGVPILRAHRASFRKMYDAKVMAWTYPEKLALMEWLPITSSMTVREMTEFLDTVQRECLSQGLRLTDPDPDLATYQARYRAKEEA